MEARRRRRPGWLRILFGAGLLGLLLAWVDWERSAEILGGAQLSFVAAATLAVVAGMVFSSWKWLLLLRANQIPLRARSALECYWIGNFFSNYLPTNVGGDVVRYALLRKFGRPAEVAASLLVERLMGFLVLVGLVALALFARPAYYAIHGLQVVLWLAVAGAGIAIAVLLTAGRPVLRATERWAEGGDGLIGRWLPRVRSLAAAVETYRRRPRTLALAVLLSVGFYAVLIGFHYLVLRAVGIDLGLLEVAFLAPVIPFVSLLPVSLNAIGLAEGAFVLFYHQAGVSTEAALAAAILRRLILLGVSLIGGALWLMHGRVQLTRT